MGPLITIGIPFYNAELYIEKSIRSILNQSYENWELFLIDDGSNDNSLFVARQFVDPRISLIVDGQNLGLIVRLNQVIDMANGEFIARMDADDIMTRYRLERQLEVFSKDEDCDVIGSGYFVIDNCDKVFGEKREVKILKSREDVLSKGGLAHPTVMARTAWYRKNKYASDALRFEDFELWFRSVESSRFIVLNESLLYYRSIGVPTLSKYVKTNIGIVKYLRRECANHSSCSPLLLLYIALYFLKIIFYGIFSFLNLLNYVIKARYRPLTGKELVSVQQNLFDSIKVTIYNERKR